MARLADKVAEIDQQQTTVSAVSDTITELLRTLVREVAKLKIANSHSRNSSHSKRSSRNMERFRSMSGTRLRGR